MNEVLTLLMSSMDLAVSDMLIRDTRVFLHEHFVCDDVLLVPRNCNLVAHVESKLRDELGPR